jgi:hypothetical protein
VDLGVEEVLVLEGDGTRAETLRGLIVDGQHEIIGYSLHVWA